MRFLGLRSFGRFSSQMLVCEQRHSREGVEEHPLFCKYLCFIFVKHKIPSTIAIADEMLEV